MQTAVSSGHLVYFWVTGWPPRGGLQVRTASARTDSSGLLPKTTSTSPVTGTEDANPFTWNCGRHALSEHGGLCGSLGRDMPEALPCVTPWGLVSQSAGVSCS